MGLTEDAMALNRGQVNVVTNASASASGGESFTANGCYHCAGCDQTVYTFPGSPHACLGRPALWPASPVVSPSIGGSTTPTPVPATLQLLPVLSDIAGHLRGIRVALEERNAREAEASVADWLDREDR